MAFHPYIPQLAIPGAYAGGSGEPPFQINEIHSMAWHACLEVKIFYEDSDK